MKPNIVVANVSSPELNHLSAELSRRNGLKAYVRRYCNKGRWMERLAERMPVVGPSFLGSLGRRKMPSGLDLSLVQERGVVQDFLFALATRYRRIGMMFDSDTLMRTIERRIDEAAAAQIAERDIVVAAYYAARASFRRAALVGATPILNYPIAHHRFQESFFAEEKALSGAFASLVPEYRKAKSETDLLDEEISSARKILVGSSFVRRSFEESGIDGNKIIVVPYGVDVSRFTPPSTERGLSGKFRIMFAGSVGQRKGIGYLLQGYAKFAREDSELTVVGSQPKDTRPLEPYRHLARFIPNVPQKQLALLYQQSDVFLFPTLMEGLPLVVIEAMGSGLPVIVTDRGPGDLVRDGIDGFIVPIRDPDAISEKLELLYRNPDLRLAMGKAARQRAETFTWERYAQAAADAIASAVAH